MRYDGIIARQGTLVRHRWPSSTKRTKAAHAPPAVEDSAEWPAEQEGEPAECWKSCRARNLPARRWVSSATIKTGDHVLASALLAGALLEKSTGAVVTWDQAPRTEVGGFLHRQSNATEMHSPHDVEVTAGKASPRCCTPSAMAGPADLALHTPDPCASLHLLTREGQQRRRKVHQRGEMVAKGLRQFTGDWPGRSSNRFPASRCGIRSSSPSRAM